VDDIKLKECDACDLVKYCSDQCEEDHLPQHELMCKERAAELRDEILFRQPESSHRGDCPICFLPLSIDTKSRMFGCCSTMICNGCSYANQKRELEEKLQHACPFCRNIFPKTDEEAIKNAMKRVAANDTDAMMYMYQKSYNEGDYDTAFAYLTKAAELGGADAHYNLSILYGEGKGVEMDKKKGFYHLEEAVFAGHPEARYNLACHEGRNKRYDKAVKHLIIAAKLGHDESIQALKKFYVGGKFSKEAFAAALRAHQAAVEATKSPQREVASKTV